MSEDQTERLLETLAAVPDFAAEAGLAELIDEPVKTKAEVASAQGIDGGRLESGKRRAGGRVNRWYVEKHFPDVLAVEGFTLARRYALSDVRPMAGPEASPYRYLALYEIEADDLKDAGAALQAALDRGDIPISDTFDLGNFSVDFYALIPDSEVSA